MIRWAYFNNRFIEDEKACLPLRDLAILRGFGVFDFLRFRNYSPVFIDDHLERLYYSVSAIGLNLFVEPGEMKDIIYELIKKNDLPDGGIRVSVTGGVSESGYQLGLPSWFITQHQFEEPTIQQFEKGLHLVSYEYTRQLPHIKTSDYIMGIHLQPWIRKMGADEVLYTSDGIISECPRANVFIIDKDDKLLTPSKKILGGITRKKILEAARPVFETGEKDISIDELTQAKEAFICSTTKQIIPIRTINGKLIGKGTNPVGTHILQLYQSVSAVPV